jgi:ubiquinone/menaquinone biosynthesis C-methylase UbiE
VANRPGGRRAARSLGVASVEGLRILELGCGDGRLTFQIAGRAASALAVDPDADRIAEARSARGDLVRTVELVVAGAAEITSPAREFDLALFSWSL